MTRSYSKAYLFSFSLDFLTFFCQDGQMTQAVTNEWIYEVLKSIQAQVVLTRENVTSIKARLTSLDTHLGVIHTDMTKPLVTQ